MIYLYYCGRLLCSFLAAGDKSIAKQASEIAMDFVREMIRAKREDGADVDREMVVHFLQALRFCHRKLPGDKYARPLHDRDDLCLLAQKLISDEEVH